MESSSKSINLPPDKKVKLSRVTFSANRREYVATHNLTQSSIDEVKSQCKLRWEIEEFHRDIKQLTRIECCQYRRASIPRNHIACALLFWVGITRMAKYFFQTVYQLKASFLANYFSQ